MLPVLFRISPCILGLALCCASLERNRAWAQDVADSRAGLPSPQSQQRISQQLEETLSLSKATTAGKRQQAIRELLKMANDPATAPDEQYMVLQTAIPLLRETGDVAGMRTALRKLVETFQIDPLVEPARQWDEFLTLLKSPSVMEVAVKELIGVVEAANRWDRFREARQWLDAAEKSAKKINAKSSLTLLADCRQAVTDREQAFDAWKTATLVLESTPDDPKANFISGLWLTVFAEDPETGLLKLSKGSDAKWRTVAEAELSGKTDFETRLARADGWWEVAQSTTGPARQEAQRRALDGYAALEAEATSPLVKARVAKRKTELAAIVKPKPPSKLDDKNELPVGEWIDLLSMVKLPDHTVMGNWKRMDGALICEAATDARFMAPVAVAGNYELLCKFTRRTNQDSIELMLPVGETACSYAVDSSSGTITGLGIVDKRPMVDRVGTSSAIRRTQPLPNGVAHELRVTVSWQGKNVTIQCGLDGSGLFSWTGTESQLSQWPRNVLPNLSLIGFKTQTAVTDVHELKLRLNRGGRGYRLGEDWKNPLNAIADQPSADVVKRCLDWKGKKYFISDTPLLLPDAQLLANQLNGRLLTISSPDEEKFIFEQSRGRKCWMAGWRPPSSNLTWRDERNRPLRYLGRWAKDQPDFANGREWNLAFWMNKDGSGWHDVRTEHGNTHAVIEWGEEYPDDAKADAK